VTILLLLSFTLYASSVYFLSGLPFKRDKRGFRKRKERERERESENKQTYLYLLCFLKKEEARRGANRRRRRTRERDASSPPVQRSLKQTLIL